MTERDEERAEIEEDKRQLGDYKRPTMPFERKASIDRGVGAWASIGIEFGLYVVLFFLGGKWLDGKFGWHPWGAAMGGLLGALVGMIQLIRRTTRMAADDTKGTSP